MVAGRRAADFAALRSGMAATARFRPPSQKKFAHHRASWVPPVAPTAFLNGCGAMPVWTGAHRLQRSQSRRAREKVRLGGGMTRRTKRLQNRSEEDTLKQLSELAGRLGPTQLGA